MSSESSSSLLLKAQIIDLLNKFETHFEGEDVRARVIALLPAYDKFLDLGQSLIPNGLKLAARTRILHYFQLYPFTVLAGREIMLIAGISEWARRLRELRVEHGWKILNGITIQEMSQEDEFTLEGVDCKSLKPDDYILVDIRQDREAAYRWNLAKEIRNQKSGVRDKILKYLLANVGQPVTGEELRYVAKDATEWARRTRELRTQEGWAVKTRNTGLPDLPVGVYMLEHDLQAEPHDRLISDAERGKALRRDNYTCRECGWNRSMQNPDDFRFLELHHVKHHVKGGDNTAENLKTLCNFCHDEAHRKEKMQ